MARKLKKNVKKELIIFLKIAIPIIALFIFIFLVSNIVDWYSRLLINPNNLNEVDVLNKHQYDLDNLKEIDGKRYYLYEDGSKSKIGIDVSKYQGDIDWQKVKDDDIDFAIIRVGYRGYESGALFLDSTFKYNIENAQANNIEIGVYFFSQAINKNEAIDEADYVIKHIKDYNLYFPIVYDMEDFVDKESRIDNLSIEDKTDIALSFCQRLEQKGYGCMIYGNRHWLQDNFNIKRLANYPFWIAQYNENLDFEYELSIWQYTDSGNLNGIEGNVDMNIYFNGKE